MKRSIKAAPRRTFHRLILLPLLWALIACGGSGLTLIDGFTSSALATGTVRNSAGTPVPGAGVRLFSLLTCADTLAEGSGQLSVYATDSLGAYTGRVISLSAPTARCIEARVTRSASDTTTLARMRSTAVSFRAWDDPAPPDTARIDIVIQ